MNCAICGKPVVLVPSATERAQRYGGTPGDYVRLFRTHTKCTLDKRASDTSELMKRLSKTRG